MDPSLEYGIVSFKVGPDRCVPAPACGRLWRGSRLMKLGGMRWAVCCWFLASICWESLERMVAGFVWNILQIQAARPSPQSLLLGSVLKCGGLSRAGSSPFTSACSELLQRNPPCSLPMMPPPSLGIDSVIAVMFMSLLLAGLGRTSGQRLVRDTRGVWLKHLHVPSSHPLAFPQCPVCMDPGVRLAKHTRVADYLLSVLKGSTPERYRAAAEDFRTELLAQGLCLEALTEEELDYALADRLIDMNEEGEGTEQIGKAGMLVSAISKMRPRERYKVAWRVLDAWRVQRPPLQAPTFPQDLALGLVTWLLMAGRPHESAAVLLCYVGLLRVSEALRLRASNVRLVQRSVVLLLGDTKRGQEQSVVLEHPRVTAWLLCFMARFPVGGEELFIDSSYSKVTRWMRKGCAALGFGAIHWTTHGLRRGGATCLLSGGTPLSGVMTAGRWLTERSCREYLRRGEVMVTRLRGDIPKFAWQRADALAAVGEDAWKELGSSTDKDKEL